MGSRTCRNVRDAVSEYIRADEFPAWVIIYGSWTRTFYAFPMLASESGELWIEEHDPNELARRIRETEHPLLSRVRKGLESL